jgi:hypothetical protein
MMPPEINAPPKPARPVIRRDGRIYVSRQAERRLFFTLTMIMLVLGILYRLGVL